jgi:NitT/TauT family transport system substrate-binding protein
MIRRLKIPGVMVGVLVVVTVLHLWLNVGFGTVFRPPKEPKFRVGFLPVTCHLTCPVTDWINTNIAGE